ncbi:hypothetical protein GJA_3355 [Janthinobacterium agaricidamnosum NBRC 102515 = DSM 9628]|uniref:Uncharacterized protein n=1 Tax=Janthinobacterium agaricidamnosum NBRC 102515 = DSM 9628 TaxID=1349767 RepID=W0V583_9BURK|nr:hypothetical protein [Janthinobacterium agaricidamnosum]CDG83974.1 hypothetical protein GJA_3355 [Janthinobacterium agaricidamnosum NBRC 102515 = DSM 9628]
MDQALLKTCASELDQLLARYGQTDAEAASLHRSLGSLIGQALAGTLAAPLEWGGDTRRILFYRGHLASIQRPGTGLCRIQN